jgi:integrase
MSSRGSIQRRGARSWRIRIEDGIDDGGRRKRHTITFKGTRQDAQKELTRLLGSADTGTLTEPSKLTVAEQLRTWLDEAHELSPKTAERFRQLAEYQIIPHLGNVPLQKLKPAQLQAWHAALLQGGGTDGQPLAARTVGHAHRVLHQALQKAVVVEMLARNVAAVVQPPAIKEEEVEILDADQIDEVMAKLAGHWLHPIAALALATGMRRGEILATRVADLDLDVGTVRVERSLEETGKSQLRFKAPKSKHGRRTISLPSSAVAVLREHRRRVLETRMALGLGKPEADRLMFSKPDGSPLSPDNLSRDWCRTCRRFGLPVVMLHALRHTHASALIAKGIDVVQISRRLGHSSPVITLETYAHLFKTVDGAAAAAAESLFRKPAER